jgi:hypothetical protein
VKHSITLIIFIALAVMMTACSVEPGKDNIKDSIIRHFETRDYKVVDIEIDKIEPFPLGKRDYMAPKKYTVYISLIKLKAGAGSEDNSQPPLIFKNASITISSTDEHGKWIVTDIEGINVI